MGSHSPKLLPMEKEVHSCTLSSNHSNDQIYKSGLNPPPQILTIDMQISVGEQ